MARTDPNTSKSGFPRNFSNSVGIFCFISPANLMYSASSSLTNGSKFLAEKN